MASLQAELEFQEGAGRMSRPHPPWSVITDLPYLDACLKEALRLHPPFCLPFERIVPATGMTVSGRYLPPGTTVGMNPWVINRNRQVFGEDADMWRPKRWLSDAHSHTIMEKTMFSVCTTSDDSVDMLIQIGYSSEQDDVCAWVRL